MGWGASGLCPFEVLGWVGSPALSGVPEGCEVVKVFGRFRRYLEAMSWLCQVFFGRFRSAGRYHLSLFRVWWSAPHIPTGLSNLLQGCLKIRAACDYEFCSFLKLLKLQMAANQQMESLQVRSIFFFPGVELLERQEASLSSLGWRSVCCNCGVVIHHCVCSTFFFSS